MKPRCAIILANRFESASHLQATKGVDYKGMIRSLEKAPFKSVVVLHACAHNPTGELSRLSPRGCSHAVSQGPLQLFRKELFREKVSVSPKGRGRPTSVLSSKENASVRELQLLRSCSGVDLCEEEWRGVLKVCCSRQLLPIIDSAYQGFASGDLVRDAFAIRLFTEEFKGGFFVTQSFAKNMGLYGERIGMVHAICSMPEEAEAVLSQLKIVARRMYSSPPLHGARIVARVLGNERNRQQWQEELKSVSERIKQTRQLLRNGLEQKQAPGSWEHITDQIGMFSYTGLTRERQALLAVCINICCDIP